MPILALIAAVAAILAVQGAMAQRAQGYGGDAAETRAAFARAREQARDAASRADALEARARSARQAADKTASEAAALAARIQQSEAGITAAEARIALAGQQRAALDRRLAVRRGPLIRLTAGLQKLARRPLALSILRPGSLTDTVHVRAILETTLPEVRRRTAALRGEIARARAIEAEAGDALAALRSGESELESRRRQLAAVESRQRMALRSASGAAAREAERALALAEEARDLDGLVGSLDRIGDLRRTLAALPGPRLRPARPEDSGFVSDVDAGPPSSSAPAGSARPAFQLPVAGRTIAGFGAAGEGGVRSGGISLAPADGAQVVSPGAGRIAFAGPFRGFDRIVIIEHSGGFTSLVTGLARVDVAVGQSVVAGSPLGVAGIDRPAVGFELRRDGAPVNPAEYLR